MPVLLGLLPRHPKPWIAAAVTVMVVAGTVVWRGVEPGESSAAFERLVRAGATDRTLEGRLTGGFAHRRLNGADHRSASDADVELLSAAAELQQKALAVPSARHLHAWGVAQLLLGKVEAGVDTLESSVLEDDEPHALADLAVGRLELATDGDRPEELPRAMEAVEKALASDPALVAAWFTKALVLERLRMPRQARAAWKKYLELDSASGWTREAGNHLRALDIDTAATRWPAVEKQLLTGAITDDLLDEATTAFAFDVREMLVRHVIPAWAAAAESSTAQQPLLRLTPIANRLERDIPDTFFARVRQEIDASQGAGRRALASGVRELAAGLQAQAAEQPTSSIQPHLDAAFSILQERRSVLALSAQLALARLANTLQRHDEVAAHAAAVALQAERLGLPAIEARARWILGVTAFTTSRWADAASEYERAIALCRLTGERGLESNVHQNAAVLSRFLGSRRAAWEHRASAAAALPAHRPLQVHTFLTSGAATASAESLPLTALLFQHEVVENARAALPVGPQTEAHINRARMLVRFNRYADATRDLDDAGRLLDAVKSEGMRNRFRRALFLASAEVRTGSDPARAAEDAARAIALITDANEQVRLAEASLLQSRALTRLGRTSEARAAVLQGISAFEASLRSIDPRDPVRVAAVDPVWALYADAARLELVSGPEHYASAFEFSERGRSRTQRDLLSLPPLPLEEVKRRLGPREAILVLDQAADDLLSWWITSEDVRVDRTALRLDELERLVTAHRRSIDRGQRRHPSGARLFDLAIRRHWTDVRKMAVVAVIADGPWNRVAWPALWDSSSQIELVSAVAVVRASSATMALNGRTAGRRAPQSALIVSAPVSDAGPALPDAIAEAREIAAIYPRRALLEGADVTPERLLELAGDADVIHVSSHAIEVAAYPQLSHLVLGRGASGRLFVRDLVTADMSGVDLAVLAACSTAGRSYARGEGTVGLAWGFLTAGARQVIATLQDIEDGAARRLFPKVHRLVAEGRGPAEALHSVQRELAAAGDPPRAWAIVAVYGGL